MSSKCADKTVDQDGILLTGKWGDFYSKLAPTTSNLNDSIKKAIDNHAPCDTFAMDVKRVSHFIDCESNDKCLMLQRLEALFPVGSKYQSCYEQSVLHGEVLVGNCRQIDMLRNNMLGDVYSPLFSFGSIPHRVSSDIKDASFLFLSNDKEVLHGCHISLSEKTGEYIIVITTPKFDGSYNNSEVAIICSHKVFAKDEFPSSEASFLATYQSPPKRVPIPESCYDFYKETHNISIKKSSNITDIIKSTINNTALTAEVERWLQDKKITPVGNVFEADELSFLDEAYKQKTREAGMPEVDKEQLSREISERIQKKQDNVRNEAIIFNTGTIEVLVCKIKAAQDKVDKKYTFSSAYNDKSFFGALKYINPFRLIKGAFRKLWYRKKRKELTAEINQSNEEIKRYKEEINKLETCREKLPCAINTLIKHADELASRERVRTVSHPDDSGVETDTASEGPRSRSSSMSDADSGILPMEVDAIAPKDLGLEIQAGASNIAKAGLVKAALTLSKAGACRVKDELAKVIPTLNEADATTVKPVLALSETDGAKFKTALFKAALALSEAGVAKVKAAVALSEASAAEVKAAVASAPAVSLFSSAAQLPAGRQGVSFMPRPLVDPEAALSLDGPSLVF